MNNNILKVFIGYDPVESVAWHTMAHSILRQCSRPVALIPVNIENMKDIFTRERDPKQSNSFSFTRFLVPYLCDYSGYGIFFDCDMMLRTDLSEILNVIESQPGKAVYVVKHDYTPSEETKYLNTVQYAYPRKNWSSTVLWNCGHPSNKAVDLKFVNEGTGLELHRFTWLEDDEIGELDIRWNWLVGDYKNPPTDVKNIHWTIGGPYFEEYKDADFADEWFDENKKMQYCLQRNEMTKNQK